MNGAARVRIHEDEIARPVGYGHLVLRDVKVGDDWA